MKLYLFSNFAKRKNSTLQPVISTANKSYDVYLKVNTDYDTPTFEIHDDAQLFPVYTYAYLQDNQRYYFITTCRQRNSRTWEIVCELDFLATYKATIQASTCYVSYSSTDYSELLNDSRVPKLNASRILKSLDYNTIFGDHTYDYLWVAGENGTVCYRCNVKDVTSAIFTAADQSFVQNLCESWSDIQSCILYARSYSLDTQSSGTSEHIIIGKYDTEVNGARLSDSDLIEVRSGLTPVDIPHTYTDFRRFAFSLMKLSLPFIGVIELSISDFVTDPAEEAHVNVEYVLNLASGVIVYRITNDDGGIIGVYNGVAGRAKPVSLYTPFSAQGVLTGAGGTLAAATGIALATTGVGIAAGAIGAIAGIAQTFSAGIDSSGSTIGTNDGSAEEHINNEISLTVEEYDSLIEPSNLTALAGRPCGKVRSLTGLTGFVQTIGASIAVNANSNVIDNLNTALDAGIYIE